MFSKDFWLRAFERAAKTAAQFAIVAIGANTMDVISVGWQVIAGAAASGFIVSALTSVASSPFGDVGTPSLVSVKDTTEEE